MKTKLPLVLVGGVYKRRLHPVNCSVSLTLEPLSTVTMTVPATDEVSDLDWVKVYTPDGECGYYRVASITQDMVNGMKEVYLEHGACVLDDRLIPENTGKDMLEKTDTIANLLEYFLGFQSRWTAGTVEAQDTIYIQPGDSSVMTAILTMMQSIPDYQLEFVQESEHYWHIDIKQRPTVAVCEGRLSRNLKTCEIEQNKEGICTKVITDAGTFTSPNANVIGVFEQTLSINENLEEEQKTRIAQSFLAQHDHPQISISISAVELSQITGLDIDSFKLGTRCRIVIPWLGITQDEIIVDKTYRDIFAAPEDVSFSLANTKPDLSLAVAAVTGGGGGGGGGGGDGKGGEKARKKRFETKFEKTDQYFRLLATDTQWDEMEEHGEITAYGQIVLTADTMQTVVAKTGVTDMPDGSPTMFTSITQSAEKLSLVASESQWTAQAELAELARKDPQAEYTAAYQEVIDGGGTQAEAEAAGEAARQAVLDARQKATLDSKVSLIEVTVDGITLDGKTITIKGETVDVLAQEDVSITGKTIKVGAQTLNVMAQGDITLTGKTLTMDGRSIALMSQDDAFIQGRTLYINGSSINVLASNDVLLVGKTLTVQGTSINVLAQEDVSISGKTITVGANSLNVLAQGDVSLIGNTLHVGTLSMDLVARDEVSINGNIINIKGQRVNLGNYVTVSNLEANYATINALDTVDGRITNLIGGYTQFTSLNASSANISSMSYNGNSAVWNSVYAGTKSAMFIGNGHNIAIEYTDLPHYHHISCSESGGVVTITSGIAQDTPGVDSFDIASTKFYQDAVEAAYASGQADAANITIDEVWGSLDETNSVVFSAYSNGALVDSITENLSIVTSVVGTQMRVSVNANGWRRLDKYVTLPETEVSSDTVWGASGETTSVTFTTDVNGTEVYSNTENLSFVTTIRDGQMFIRLNANGVSRMAKYVDLPSSDAEVTTDAVWGALDETNSVTFTPYLNGVAIDSQAITENLSFVTRAEGGNLDISLNAGGVRRMRKLIPLPESVVTGGVVWGPMSDSNTVTFTPYLNGTAVTAEAITESLSLPTRITNGTIEISLNASGVRRIMKTVSIPITSGLLWDGSGNSGTVTGTAYLDGNSVHTTSEPVSLVVSSVANNQMTVSLNANGVRRLTRDVPMAIASGISWTGSGNAWTVTSTASLNGTAIQTTSEPISIVSTIDGDTMKISLNANGVRRAQKDVPVVVSSGLTWDGSGASGTVTGTAYLNNTAIRTSTENVSIVVSSLADDAMNVSINANGVRVLTRSVPMAITSVLSWGSLGETNTVTGAALLNGSEVRTVSEGTSFVTRIANGEMQISLNSGGVRRMYKAVPVTVTSALSWGALGETNTVTSTASLNGSTADTVSESLAIVSSVSGNRMHISLNAGGVRRLDKYVDLPPTDVTGSVSWGPLSDMNTITFSASLNGTEKYTKTENLSMPYSMVGQTQIRVSLNASGTRRMTKLIDLPFSRYSGSTLYTMGPNNTPQRYTGALYVYG